MPSEGVEQPQAGGGTLKDDRGEVARLFAPQQRKRGLFLVSPLTSILKADTLHWLPVDVLVIFPWSEDSGVTFWFIEGRNCCIRFESLED